MKGGWVRRGRGGKERSTMKILRNRVLTLLLGDLSDRAVFGASDRTYTHTMSGQYSGSWVRNTRADLDLFRNLAEGGVWHGFPAFVRGAFGQYRWSMYPTMYPLCIEVVSKLLRRYASEIST